jgi:predicted house-cleaning noncanonical NTP pyrophosphatase (MazG superfamily)
MKHGKLVRDGIPEHIARKGGTHRKHAAGEVEYWQKLLEKLQEEVNEFMKDQNEEELADVLEVIDAICKFKNFDRTRIMEVKNEKLRKRGGFEKRIVLDESKS